ncbi:hypothetical protein RHGRI_009049 [Rhododendron griersonianum]|uniref:Aldehyde dehydrogenase domain-containing protein n=1 Tax=Rhododendron griersonianum TaxID=479676 RepID=A0AAV6L3U2_9ERIC|nr:hypothetical protein RHGRI_009049 [Rhododendron griersonianum]
MGAETKGNLDYLAKIPEIKFTKLFINGEFVDSVSDLIDENVEELAALETIDAGKIFGWGKAFEIPGTAESLRYYAGAADKIHGETLKMSSANQGYTLREPIGVVGHIIPWNFPSTMFLLKVSPALAAGCTMIVKPAEQTPLNALYFAHLAKFYQQCYFICIMNFFFQAGIPDGVLNVITGYGSTAGAAISSHMDIDKVSFTGSTEVGRLVMQAAATSNLKPGEVCVAGSRVFAQEGIYDQLAKKLGEKAKTWVVGDPFDPNVRQGPQIDKTQYEKVLSYIEHGKREGATLVTGGKPCGEKGYYIEPTIFSEVKDDMKIAKDEIFGPVMSLMKFKTVEEAIQRANATRYGLAAGIVTKDLNVANTVSRSIRAGTIWINTYYAFDKDCPFGGFKMSGFGKDTGMQALEQYLLVKSVVTPIYNSPWL